MVANNGTCSSSHLLRAPQQTSQSCIFIIVLLLIVMITPLNKLVSLEILWLFMVILFWQSPSSWRSPQPENTYSCQVNTINLVNTDTFSNFKIDLTSSWHFALRPGMVWKEQGSIRSLPDLIFPPQWFERIDPPPSTRCLELWNIPDRISYQSSLSEVSFNHK